MSRFPSSPSFCSKSLFTLPLILQFFLFLFQNCLASPTTLSSDGERRHRQWLPASQPSVVQYLQVQHSLGNRNSRFTICGTTTLLSNIGMSSDSLVWRLNVQEVPAHFLALPPAANFSVYGRQERAVGNLGYSFLSLDLSQDQRSSTHEVSYAFLIVDWSSSTLNGVVLKSGKVTYVDEHSFIFVETSLHDPKSFNQEVLFSQPFLTAGLSPRNLQFQINVVIDINFSLVQQIGGGSLCHTFGYLNSLLTAINVILEFEISARLNVELINQTSLYDDYDEVFDQKLSSLGHHLSNRTNVGSKTIDATYVFLGGGSTKFDSESNAASTRTTLFSTICGPQQGLGMMIHWRGNASSWGEGWFQDLDHMLRLVGRTIGSKVVDRGLLSEHIVSIDRLFSGTKSENKDIQRPQTAFSEMRSFLVTTQQDSLCVLTPSNFDDVTIHRYENDACPIMSPTILSADARAFKSSVEWLESEVISSFPTTATVTPASVTSFPIATTNSPLRSTKSPTTIDSPAVATNPPTDGLLKTMAPIAEPTTQPTTSSRPTGEDLPTASDPPITASPVKPPTPLFPTYMPTDGSAVPTIRNGNRTYPPTVEVLYPTGEPSISRDPSFSPSSKPVFIPSVAPTVEPSSSLIPTEFYRPSAIPSQSSYPSAPPSEPDYAGDLTNSIGNSDAYVSSFGCPSSASADLIFDGTTKEFICGEQASLNPARILLDQGFFITPNLVNPSIVEKLRVYADHTCIECDAVKYMIQGWAKNEWVLISSGDLPWAGKAPARNRAGIPIKNSTYDHGDEALSFAEINLNNTMAFSEYRLTFPETRNESYSLVVAEVELPGRTFEKTSTNSPTKIIASAPSRRPARSTSKPTPRSTGAKTSKPTSRQTARPTRRKNKLSHKPTPRPFRQRSTTSSKTTKSKTSDSFPGSKWDDIFYVETHFEKSFFTDSEIP